MGIWIAVELLLWQLGFLGAPADLLDPWFQDTASREVEAVGTVDSCEITSYGVKIILRDTSVQIDGLAGEPGCLLVYFREPVEGKIGNRIRVRGELSPFEKAGNPGQFDVWEYYRSKGVTYQLWGDDWEWVSRDVELLREFLAQVRLQSMENLRQAAEGEDLGVLAAVFLGDTSELPEETRALYQAGGISHILAVSGLHVSLLGMSLFRLLCRLPLPRRLPEVLSGLVMAGYVVVTGASVSSRRALILFLAMLLARSLGRSYDMLSALGLAGILILASQPLELFTASFQLSFGSVAALGLLMPELTEWLKPKRNWEKALASSLCAVMGTLPLGAWHFYQVSLSGIWLNPLVLPLASLLLLSATLAAVLTGLSPALGSFFAGTGHYILKLYRFLCETGGFSITVGKPAGWELALYYGALALLVLGARCWRKRRETEAEERKDREGRKNRPVRFLAGRWVVLMICVAVGFLSQFPLPARNLTVVSLDVGQGDCTFFKLPGGEAWLVDGGSSDVEQVGKWRILPFLQWEGIRRLEGVVLSHSDADHVNGILELLEGDLIPVGCLILPRATASQEGWEALRQAAERRNTPVYTMEAGEAFVRGEVTFTCLYPQAVAEGEDANSHSLTLLVEWGAFSGLFPGDLGTEQELRFQEQWRPVSLLKVGHHGSRNSSGTAFLEALTPRAVVISCGAGNSYGHPHLETLARLEEAGSRVYRTDRQGAVRFLVRDGAMTVETFR